MNLPKETKKRERKKRNRIGSVDEVLEDEQTPRSFPVMG